MFFALLVFIGTFVVFAMFNRFMREGKSGIAKILYIIAVIINIILAISLKDGQNFGGNRFLTSFKNTLLFVDIILLIMAPLGTKVHLNKANRILLALNGELGNKLKTYLPNDAVVYTVNTMAMTWQRENGDSRVISFSSLGFATLPEGFEYVICQWTRENIVYDQARYHLEEIVYEGERQENTQTITYKKLYDNKYKVTYEPGSYVTTKHVLGQALVHSGFNFEGKKINTTPLKKW